MTVPSNAGIFFPEIQCEIPFKHLTLISGRQMTIRASTIVTFLLAMTKAPSYLLLSACIRIVFNCSDLVRLCQNLPQKYPKIALWLSYFLTTKNWVKMALVRSNGGKLYQPVWV